MTDLQYSNTKRREILEAIPLRDDADSELVIAELAEAATRSVEARQSWKSILSSRNVGGALKRLKVTLKTLDRQVRRAVFEAATNGTTAKVIPMKKVS